MKEKNILPRYKISDQTLLLATEITACLAQPAFCFPFSLSKEKEQEIFASELEAWMLLDTTIDEENLESPLRSQAAALLRGDDFEPDVYERRDILQAHLKLLQGIVVNPGSFRLEAPLWTDAKKLDYAPPAAKKVADYVKAVLDWGKIGKKVVPHPLIQATVIGYALDVIQPFETGSRMLSLLWMRLILEKWNSAFAHIPLFTTLLDHADGYFAALRNALQEENAGKFIDSMLQYILDALHHFIDFQQEQKPDSRFVKALLETLGDRTLSTKELMDGLKLKHRPTFRDHYLLPALQSGLVEMTIPDKPNSCRQKYRRRTDGKTRL